MATDLTVANTILALCIHTIKMTIEGILAAGLIAFLFMMYSCCVISGKCSRAEEKRRSQRSGT